MSNSRQWEAYFGRCGWSGPSSSTGTAGPFGSGNYTDGHSDDTRAASPSDQLQYMVEGKLRGDDLVTAYVPADRINRYGVRPQDDLLQLPRCYVFGGAVDGSLITLANNMQIDVFVEVVFGLTSVQPASDGGATLASLLDYIGWKLVQDQSMTVLTSTGPQALTQTIQIRPFATAEIEDKNTGLRLAYSQTLQITMQALTDYRTGRFSNLP